MTDSTTMTTAQVIEAAVILKTSSDSAQKRAAKASLEKHAPDALGALTTAMKSLAKDDAKVTKQLTELADAGFPDVPAFAEQIMERQGRGLGLTYLCTVGGPVAVRALTKALDDQGELTLSRTKHIPAELAEVQGLRTLHLWKCPQKKLPEEVLSLAHLPALRIGEMKLSAVPEDLARLHRLEMLELNFMPGITALGGALRLPSLRVLNMASVGITEVPDAIEKLAPTLERLHLPGNDALTRISPAIGSLEKLRWLSFNHCKALETLPAEIWSLPKLEVLDLSGLVLGQLPEDLGNLKTLRELGLRGATAVLPASFGQLEQLQELDLSGAQITSLPDSFYALPKLAKLRIERSTLEPLQAEITQRMPNVTIFR